jgi:hypothetical protein
MPRHHILVIYIALLVLLALAAVLAELFLRKRRGGSEKASPAPAKPRPVGCCGLHAVCEKELLGGEEAQAEYYDDEELDAFRGRAADSYGDGEIEQFEDVLYTMRPGEVAGWTVSLRQRGIALPETLRDEVLMMVGDSADTAEDAAGETTAGAGKPV